MDYLFVYSCRRFLLGKHKAAIEVYNEAARLNEKDWVNTHTHTLSCGEFVLVMKSTLARKKHIRFVEWNGPTAVSL